jgi:drug/metabolite transporter (DMT)-like permease
MKGKQMSLFYSSILIAVISTVMYHVTIKFIPQNANPALSLLVTYLVAALLCVVLLFFMPLKSNLGEGLKQLNWASVGLVFALVGLEIGFILVYRAGWNISVAAIAVNVAVTILLVPVGILLFVEKLSAVNLIGIFVSIIGLIMVNVK